ncbi:MAG: NYN domain-containing protein [Waterburya sp.]
MTSFEPQCYSYSRTLQLTAAILLDVENFCLKLDLEEYLKCYCTYPITIKFAVANWQNNAISNLDLYLHQQRYQLIHVPKAKDGADAQILTLGTSLLLQYPQIAEMIIVSHDSIVNYLHQSLQALGCKTYKVYQESSNIYIHNFNRNRTDYIAVPTNTNKQTNKTSQTSKPDPQKILQDKIELTLNKLKSSSVNPITISLLAQEYKNNYQQSLSKYIKDNKLGGSVIKFLQNNCTDKIDIKQKANNYYLSLKTK